MRVHTAEVSLHNNMLLCFFILPHPSLTVSLRFVLIAIFSSFLGERSECGESNTGPSSICTHARKLGHAFVLSLCQLVNWFVKARRRKTVFASLPNISLIKHWWWSLASSSNPLSSNIQSKVQFDISIAKVPIYFFFARENKYNSICWHSHGKSAIGQREKNNTHNNLWPTKLLTFWAVMSCKSDAGLYVNWQLSLLVCDFIDTLRMESFLGAHVAVQIGFIV